MNRWRTLNAWLGYLILGLPAVLVVPALIATLARFGVWDTLAVGVTSAAWACAPAALWVRYTRRNPTTRRGVIGWAVVAAVAFTMIVTSPIWFWSGPVVLVLLSEVFRVAATAVASRPTGVRRPSPGPSLRSAR